LAQKAQLHIPLLEHIDVTAQEYQVPQEAAAYCGFDNVLPEEFKRQLAPDAGMQATVKATIPRIAYVRGKEKKITLFPLANHDVSQMTHPY
jgi:hypothetical protein